MVRRRGLNVLLAVVSAAGLLTGCSGGPVGGVAPDTAASTCSIAQVVRGWPLRKVAAQVVVVPVSETSLGDASAEVAAGVGGVILFGSEAPSDLGAQLSALLAQAPDGIVPIVMTDEEGGPVQRMANLVGWMPSARRMAATMTLMQVRHLAHRVALRMAAAHVTMNLAPVLDLDERPGPNADNPDGRRSFSIDPAVARAFGLAFARGMRSAGVVPVVKHFPGLGHATANTDVEAAWTLPWPELEEDGLRPFRAAVRAGLPAVMVANARIPGLTGLPASLSYRVVHGVLRRGLGFGGLVMTDSLTAGAVVQAGYSLRQAAVRAVLVGNDMVLFGARADSTPEDVARRTSAVVTGLVHAVRSGELPLRRLRDAAVRVLTAKGAALCG